MAADRTLDDALRAAADEVHRAAAAATRRARPAPGSRGTPRPGARIRSWWTAGLVAAGVVAVVALPVRLLGPDRATSGPAPTAPVPSGGTPAPGPAPSVTATPAPTGTLPPTPACGSTALPVPLYLPDGYLGPIPGPAQGAPAPARPTQLVVHWTGAGGDVEARWPAEFGASSGTSDYLTMAGPLGADPDVTAMIKVPGRSGECEVVSLSIYGQSPPGFGNPLSPFQGSPDDPPEIRAKFVALATIVTDPKELQPVSGSRTLGSAPKGALPCPGNVPEPIRRGSVTGSAPQRTARQAVAHWLVQEDGYHTLNVAVPLTELRLPRGAVMFGRRVDGGSGWVGLIWMKQIGGRWAVDHWETSGC